MIILENLLYNLYCSTPWVKVDSITYKENSIAVLKPAKDVDDPTFGQIEKKYTSDDSAYTYVRIMLRGG